MAIRDLRELGKATGVKPSADVKPPFWDTRALPIRLDRLFAFISSYQLKHDNVTPTVRMMAAEMQESENAVAYWLRQLEANGSIMIISRAPLRVMLKASAPDLVAARRVDDALKGSKIGWEVSTAGERFDAAEAQRVRIAHFIGSYEDQHGGTAPSLQEIASAVGMSGPGYVLGALTVLNKRGLITFNPDEPRSAHLTEEGRMVTGMQQKVPTRAPAKAAMSGRETGLQVARQASKDRYEQRLSAIFNVYLDFTRKHGRPPTRSEVLQHVPYKNPAALAHPTSALVQRGKLVRENVAPGIRGSVLIPVDPSTGKKVPYDARKWLDNIQSSSGDGQRRLNEEGHTPRPEEAQVAKRDRVGRRRPKDDSERKRWPLKVHATKVAQFLNAYDQSGGRPSYAEISAGTGISQHAVGGVIGWMERSGWIMRKKHFTTTPIELTDKALRHIEATQPAVEAVNKASIENEQRLPEHRVHGRTAMTAEQEQHWRSTMEEEALGRSRHNMELARRQEAQERTAEYEAPYAQETTSLHEADMEWARRRQEAEREAALRQATMPEVRERFPLWNRMPPQPAAHPTPTQQELAEIDTVDLIAELNERGFMVRRAK